MNKTVTIQTGNSDDKLTQSEWSSLVKNISSAIGKLASEIHFHGCSEGSAPWQNAVWVIDLEKKKFVELKEFLGRQCRYFKQDSIAWTEGFTEFVSSSTLPNEWGELSCDNCGRWLPAEDIVVNELIGKKVCVNGENCKEFLRSLRSSEITDEE